MLTASPAPTSLSSSRLLEHPQSLARGKVAQQVGRVCGQKGAYGGLAGPGGHPDDPWLNGLRFCFPFLCPHMFLAASRFWNESDLALNSFLATYLL